MIRKCWELALSLTVGMGLVVGSVRAIHAAPASTIEEAPVLVGFEEAEQLYLDGQVLEAIRVYQRLFVQTGEPVCLANIGRLYAERGEYELAADFYRRFLLHPRASEGQREQVRARLNALAPDDALALRDRAEHEPPALALEGPPPPPPSPPPRAAVERPSPALPTAGAVMLGLGAPSLIAGGVLVTQARSLHQEQQGGEFESYEERRALELESERKSVASISLLACGALAVVTGVVMLAVGGRRAALARQETRIRAQPTGLTLRF